MQISIKSCVLDEDDCLIYRDWVYYWINCFMISDARVEIVFLLSSTPIMRRGSAVHVIRGSRGKMCISKKRHPNLSSSTHDQNHNIKMTISIQQKLDEPSAVLEESSGLLPTHPLPSPSTFNGALSHFTYDPLSPSPTRRATRTTACQSPSSAKSSIQPSPSLSPSPSTTKRKARGRSTASSPSKRPRPSSSYRPPSTYASYPLLRDSLAPNLLILFLGVNPGLASSLSGHSYASPSNRFWRTLYSSGITPRLCTASEDAALPALYEIGNTNIVARPTRNEAELSREEKMLGWKIAEEKVRTWKPEVVAVVGKGIWDAVHRARFGVGLDKERFEYGWQSEEERVGSCEGWEGARVFVTSSTSGLAAGLSVTEKEDIWRPLGEWVKKRRVERERATAVESSS
jgi:mismatch-specific thymine-DNA glycosylase